MISFLYYNALVFLFRNRPLVIRNESHDIDQGFICAFVACQNKVMEFYIEFVSSLFPVHVACQTIFKIDRIFDVFCNANIGSV